MAPLAIPAIITAAAILGVFRILGLHRSLAGLVLAHVVLTLPHLLSTLSATRNLFDLRLDDAAASCVGAPAITFRRITLSLIAPAVVSGLLFAKVISFDEPIVSLFLSSPAVRSLTAQMWSNMRATPIPGSRRSRPCCSWSRSARAGTMASPGVAPAASQASEGTP
ncbi:hypothetical protein LNKW23_37520 [Paralimibaculum aggregatum]|uniref:ABC transmembrane type-1 domain-containing protein n=2 Tax=Paralimibaculum aggregatum TaxID=3036245 RepID=A0ABQ6LPN7_9RHOB|nr:hypothetical protein LNKW23_37520 [Limibaculum sp. NKW23]